MAAADLLRVRLPYPWSYGVTEDGRVFFINDDTKTTTWLHPMTKEPVQTGLTASSDLPRGWEHAFNSDGVLYFIDHNTQVSTFTHPVTGEVMAEEGAPQQKIESPKEKSSIEPKRGSLIKKGSKKIVDSPMAKRSEEAPVSMKGWLYKQEGGTIKQWKRRWFVLSDFCLFYYKGPEEQQTLGSILLPSYKINPCARDDGIGKKFAFKAEHQNMRTYYFAAETKEGMQKWMNAMSLATILQRDPTYQRRWQQTSQYPPHDYHSNASVERQFNPPQPSPNVSNASEDAGFGPPPHRHHLAAPNVHEAPPGRNSDGSDAMRDQSYSGGRLFDHYNPSSNGHIPQNYDPRSVPNGYGRPLPDSGMQRGSYTSESSHGDYRQRAPPYGGPGSAGPPHLPGNQPHSGDRGYPATRSSTTLPQAGPERGRSPQRLGTNNRSISLDRRQFQQDMPPSGGPPGPPTHSAPLPQHPQQQAPSQFRNREEPVRSGYVQRRPDSGDFMRQPQNMPYEQKQPGSAQPARPVSAYYEYERPQRTDQQFRDTQGGRGHGGSSEMLGPLQVHVSQESQKDAAQNSMGYSGPGRSKGDQGRPLSQYDYNRPAQGQGRSNNDESSRRELQKQESLRQLRDWHNRMQRSSLSRPDQSPNPDHSSHQPQQTQAQHLKQPVYENIPGQTARRNLSSSFQEDSPAPVRPPYPAAYRDKLVEDAAAKKTPTTAQNMLESSQNSMRHVNEPHFFQYPQVQQTRPAQPQEPSVPDSYLWAKQHVEQEEQRQKEQPKPREEMPRYPDSYLKAKDEVERMQPRPREKGGRYPSEGAAPQRGRDKLKSLDISTVKEEPDMSDQDVIATKNFKNLRKNFALNGKIRLSISASDLLGKSHEELVLLLIELRRKQSRLEAARDVYKQQLETAKVREKDFQALLQTGNRPPDYMERDHHMYLDIKKQLEDIEKQLEVHKPLVNLVDNLVKMGSLYGGDNDMFASQYKRNLLSPEEYTPPKRMLDFTRKMQEEKLAQDYEKEVKHLSEDEVDLEEKLQKLYGLDRSLQEKSFMVTSLQEDKELLEKALNNVKAQLEHSQDDLREAARLSQQQKNIEKELSKVRQQLADNSKVLEELTTENAKVEHEVKILRSKIHGVRKSTSTPTLSNNESVRAKVKLEQELSKVQDMMSGLNEQGKKLRETMQNLRNSSTDVRGSDKPQDKSSTYNETDLDSNNTKNIALSGYDRRNGRSYLDQDDDDSVQDSDTPWDISEADENTKRFFGLLPKDKPRARTLREVKQRETERRSRDRERRKPSDTQEAPEQGIRERSNSMPERGRRSQSLPRKLNEVPSLQQHAKNSVVSPKELFTGKRIKDRERRLSAAERLFPTPTNNSTPTTSAPSNSNTSTSHMPRPAATASVRPMQLSAESKARRHSELGLAPKPFQASGSTGGFSRVNPSLGPNRTGSTPNLYNTTQGTGPVKQGPAVPPKKKKGPPRRTGARYLTISSSAPLQLETSPTKKLGVQTSAGDLIINQNDPFESATGVRRGSLDFTPDYVQSTSFKNEHISIDTIEKEVLFIPGKIEIPERYVPESDEEELTEDEKRMRQKKADRIKKLLSAQSLQDWTETELDPFKQENVHDKFSEEKHHREHLLSLNQALAKEVTQKTRQVAESRRQAAILKEDQKDTDSDDTGAPKVSATYYNDPYSANPISLRPPSLASEAPL
ncbi:uncharacterized protein LOC106158612 isoform X7 [Lingula anatina]|uniref:Uncharacterized protein LOC106158612 isoform X7 n=1 Tax=Lingula anatina TaxID=7574 RepID=A0A1S3HYH1_LINAN|nr:uncharacterized protein LOC106158612 isoform X7 [Lingula anatina]|eukprot:XP_013390129.1 uncharacterized protein LOC106158612 isoform X7 [Lingula anatina]